VRATLNDVEKLLIYLQQGANLRIDKRVLRLNWCIALIQQGIVCHALQAKCCPQRGAGRAHFLKRNRDYLADRLCASSISLRVEDVLINIINHYGCHQHCQKRKAYSVVLATNDLHSSAWNCSAFFKSAGTLSCSSMIKHHLKVKQFLGNTENAVRIQILTALISYGA